MNCTRRGSAPAKRRRRSPRAARSGGGDARRGGEAARRAETAEDTGKRTKREVKCSEVREAASRPLRSAPRRLEVRTGEEGTGRGEFFLLGLTNTRLPMPVQTACYACGRVARPTTWYSGPRGCGLALQE